MQQLLDRLMAALGESPADPIDRMVVLQLADLKQMDRWGIRIHGETLHRYFDLGSLDDVDPRYPVTPEEAQALAEAMRMMAGGSCAPRRPAPRWRDAV